MGRCSSKQLHYTVESAAQVVAAVLTNDKELAVSTILSYVENFDKYDKTSRALINNHVKRVLELHKPNSDVSEVHDVGVEPPPTPAIPAIAAVQNST